MLKHRIITSALLLPLIINIIFYFSQLHFVISLLFLCMLISWEWSDIFKYNLKQKFFWLLFFFTILFFLFILIFFTSMYKTIFLFLKINVYLSLIFWCLMFFSLLYFKYMNFLFNRFIYLKYLLGMYIIIPFFSAMILLKTHIIQIDSIKNSFLLFYILLLIFINDSVAYLTGNFFGKKKLTFLSPGKTWEGLLSGIIFSILYIYIQLIFLSNKNFYILFFVSLLILFISILGDLTESMFKRIVGVKNSSNLIPGHGGILDRTDSLLPSITIFVLILSILRII